MYIAMLIDAKMSKFIIYVLILSTGHKSFVVMYVIRTIIIIIVILLDFMRDKHLSPPNFNALIFWPAHLHAHETEPERDKE